MLGHGFHIREASIVMATNGDVYKMPYNAAKVSIGLPLSPGTISHYVDRNYIFLSCFHSIAEQNVLKSHFAKYRHTTCADTVVDVDTLILKASNMSFCETTSGGHSLIPNQGSYHILNYKSEIPQKQERTMQFHQKTSSTETHKCAFNPSVQSYHSHVRGTNHTYTEEKYQVP